MLKLCGSYHRKWAFLPQFILFSYFIRRFVQEGLKLPELNHLKFIDEPNNFSEIDVNDEVSCIGVR